MTAPRILLIVGGGIAAYKACELIRLLRKRGMSVRCVLTAGGAQFVTPMTLAALSENPVFTVLWDLKDEAEMGHIQLSRAADLIVVAPATADLLAKMAAGIADDLATTVLLATDTPVLACPAMNVRMWTHPATRRNVARLRDDGVMLLDPDEGAMACGEYGPGRLPEPPAILAAIERALAAGPANGSLAEDSLANDPLANNPLWGQPDFAPDSGGESARALTGRHVLVTAGPTHEPIDPVRYIANRSSGRQGFAIAAAAARAGARVTLVAGPVTLATPPGVTRIDVETAHEMAAAVDAALPCDIAFMVAAVADWRAADPAPHKIKKGTGTPALTLTENPDILAGLARADRRPRLLVGFAAETGSVDDHGAAKRRAKGVDWIVANDVSPGPASAMGGDANAVTLITGDGIERWERMAKAQVAERLVARAAKALGEDATNEEQGDGGNDDG